MMFSRHTLAIISIVGSSLNVLGSLYLAYDLLGGEHGPLRTLTRAVTYGLLFGGGFGVFLGPVFGLVTGVAHAITLGLEFARVARQGPKPGFWYDVTMSAIRGCAFGLGTAFLFGPIFGITFGALSTIGQVIGYRAGIRPGLDYAPSTRPRMTKLLFLAVVNRAVGYSIAGYISALLAHQDARALAFGLGAGFVVGVVTGIATFCIPFVEWAAENVPAKRMGVIGVGLIVIGFALQSVQYWVTLLGVG
jgi:hypothetical protein